MNGRISDPNGGLKILIRLISAALPLLLILRPAGHARADDRVELTDGSSLIGEVISLEDGVYTIDSSALGKTRINASDVARIESRASGTGRAVPGGASSISSQVENYRASLTADPEISSMISSLASDSQLQSLLKDPEIVSAVTSADVPSLMKSDKFMDFMDNPRLREIMEKLRRKKGI